MIDSGTDPSRKLGNNDASHGQLAKAMTKAMTEAAGLLRAPYRALPLIQRLASDKLRIAFEQRHLYSYTRTMRKSSDSLKSVLGWILAAQRPDGGIAAYYSLLTGYSESYPEVTGYIVPTLYEFSRASGASSFPHLRAAERATEWLLSLQLPTGAFPAGLYNQARSADPLPSVFNTGQILQGLVRAHFETNRVGIRNAALSAARWLAETQKADGSWSGPGAYQDAPHTYYSMVAWALAELAANSKSGSPDDQRCWRAAEKNLDWTLSHFLPNGWVDGINLSGHPNYLHFIAYALQGLLETAILLRRNDAIEAVARSAWVLLRKFETNKFLPGAYESDFKSSHPFTCLTGNAQMSCVWLRLFEVTDDLRYLNAALKMNEMLKSLVPARGRRGVKGGVSGSYPIWCRYQPFRIISWGCKFFADALLMEQRLTRSLKATEIEALPCAS